MREWLWDINPKIDGSAIRLHGSACIALNDQSFWRRSRALLIRETCSSAVAPRLLVDTTGICRSLLTSEGASWLVSLRNDRR